MTSPAAPRVLRWTHPVDDASVFVLDGVLNERSELAELAQALPARATLDLAGIAHINSTGVRSWIGMLDGIIAAGKHVRLQRCSAVFMMHVNMIARFNRGFPIQSFLAPFVCHTCMHNEDVLVGKQNDLRTSLEAKRPCPSCGRTMEFDDTIEEYLDVFAEG